MTQVTIPLGSITVDVPTATGPPGPTGATGTTGAQGPKGDKGDPGTPADTARLDAIEARLTALEQGTPVPPPDPVPDPIPTPGADFVSWVGNSFAPSLTASMPHAVDGSQRLADGTLLTVARWNEDGGELCSIKADGSACAKAGDTHGWGRVGGQAVTGDANYVWQAMHSDGTTGYGPNSYGIRRFTRALGPAGYSGGVGKDSAMKTTAAEVMSLAVLGGNLFAWLSTGTILAFNASTMVSTQAIPPARPPVQASDVDSSLGGVVISQGGKNLYGLCFVDNLAVTADGKTGYTCRWKLDLDGNGGWGNPQPLCAAGDPRIADLVSQGHAYTSPVLVGPYLGTRGMNNGDVTAWVNNAPVSLGGGNATHVDTAGNVWSCSSSGAVSKRTRNGSTWSAFTAVTAKNVTGFTDIRRWGMSPSERYTIVSGFTSALPADSTAWKQAGRLLQGFDGAALKWSVTLPWGGSTVSGQPGAHVCQGWSVTDRYVVWAEFSAYANGQNSPAIVHVHDITNGLEVKTVTFPAPVGWLDTAYPVSARDLPNGQLSIAVGDDGPASNVRYARLTI